MMRLSVCFYLVENLSRNAQGSLTSPPPSPVTTPLPRAAIAKDSGFTLICLIIIGGEERTR